MKRCVAIVAFGTVLVSTGLAQSDHNNIDSGRPLRFDDAASIAYRERALEFGLSLDTFRRRAANYGFKAEYKVGFAKNQDIGITFDPSYEGSERRLNAGNVEIAYFNGFRQEIGNSPALAYRIELGLPTGRGSQGVDAKFRAIATRTLRQYDKVHLNLDANVATNPGPGERNVAFGVILGYTNPLGYPRKFDQTMVAEFALLQSKSRSEGFVGSVGLGLRRQLSPQSVLDFGISSDLFSTRGAERSPLRFVVGYSIGF